MAKPVAYEISQARGWLELQLLAYPTATAMPDLSVTYTLAHGKARSLTHWARPGIEPTTSWFLVVFITAAPQQELHIKIFNSAFSTSEI